ncbi:MAG: PIN domain-containing protein [Bryobacterales bacterium]|nr:PIN domain-containing protein [Bryobacterales bacterium]
MTGAPFVVLDACVLANFSLCDTLLRFAEPPRLYEPKWSEEIIRETTRTLESKLGWPTSLTAHLQAELRAHFGEAWISGYEPLIPQMTNDEKDRHVLAAAVHGEVPIIVTFNLRHFRSEHLAPWGIRALHPQSFLIEIFRQEESLVITKLEQQAADRSRTLRQLLNILNATAPEFVAIISAAISRK